eukprot:478940_1
MNRCIVHNVLPPDKNDLLNTATAIIEQGEKQKCYELKAKIKKLVKIYDSIINLRRIKKPPQPFAFDFYGHRDFYSLVSYLKLRLQQSNGDDHMI